ncbi:imm11 family protein, partial [Thermoflexus hugenholtzii]
DWSEDGPLTDLLFDPNFHVVSPRLKALLEDLGLGSEIQFLPIRIKGEKSGREIEGYSVANFLRRIPCLDLEHSIYGRYGEHPEDFQVFPEKIGQIRHVLKAVLQRKAIGDARVFRVDEWKYIVVVREDVKAAMEAAGITGCWFQELEVV